MKPKFKMDWLEKSRNSYNEYYKQYRAEWCRLSKLPMLDKSDWEQIEREGLYTESRARKEKVKCNYTEVAAWYKMQHGYTPLYRRVDK